MNKTAKRDKTVSSFFNAAGLVIKDPHNVIPSIERRAACNEKQSNYAEQIRAERGGCVHGVVHASGAKQLYPVVGGRRRREKRGVWRAARPP